MSDPRRCPQCGAPLPADAPEGLCPKCLLQLGFESQYGSASRAGAGPTVYQPRFVPPTVEELAARFPQLEILEEIGHGGMGVVYKARQKDLDRVVALKILRPDLEHDAAFAERFVREARALGKLSHPAIVAVYDFGRSDGLFFLVMEYVDGANLRQLERTGKLTPAEALRIVPAICEALQYAHDQGVVHRDIKPENILIEKNGRVKIADFGLAKMIGAMPDAATLTGAWHVMGTPHYMAPEQMQGAHTVDHRADIYSLGVVIYEMLTGELPVGRFPLPSHKAQVDVRLDEVVLRSLEREPERRYQHASEVQTEVETICRTSAAPRSAADIQRRRVAEELRIPAVGLLLSGALVLGLGAILAVAYALDEFNLGNVELMLLFGPSLLFGMASAFTGLHLWRIGSYRAAIAGCILLVLPVSPVWPLTIVFVVLALMTLRRPEAKAAFEMIPQAPPDRRATARHDSPSWGTGEAGNTHHPGALPTGAEPSIPGQLRHAFGFWSRPQPRYDRQVGWPVMALVALWVIVLLSLIGLNLAGAPIGERVVNFVLLGGITGIPVTLVLLTLVYVSTGRRSDSDTSANSHSTSSGGSSHAPPSPAPPTQAPAKALVAVGVIEWIACWLSCLVFAAVALSSGREVPALFPDRDTLKFLLPAVAVLGAVLSAVVILAGLKMKRLESRRFAIAGSFLAMFISPGNVIGLPIGLWALYVLTRPEVKVAFPPEGLPTGASTGLVLAAVQEGRTRLQTATDALFVLAAVLAVTGAGVFVWLWQVDQPEFVSRNVRSTLIGMSTMYLICAALIAGSAAWLRRARARLAGLIVLIVVGVFLPAVTALNVILEYRHIPVWPVMVPLWLGVPVCVWAAATLFRAKVRAAFETPATTV